MTGREHAPGDGTRQAQTITVPFAYTSASTPPGADSAPQRDMPAQPPGEAVAVPACRERFLAVAHWLLCAADDAKLARNQWASADGFTLLAAGGILSAVRIPASLVWTVAGTSELSRVGDFLARELDGGPVFMDIHSHHYYALVPPSTAWRWTGRQFPGVECLGRGFYLGVPAPHLVTPRTRAYWCVPMESPGVLCDPDRVSALVRAGQALRTVQGELA